MPRVEGGSSGEENANLYLLQEADIHPRDLRPPRRHREEGPRGHLPGERRGRRTMPRVRKRGSFVRGPLCRYRALHDAGRIASR